MSNIVSTTYELTINLFKTLLNKSIYIEQYYDDQDVSYIIGRSLYEHYSISVKIKDIEYYFSHPNTDPFRDITNLNIIFSKSSSTTTIMSHFSEYNMNTEEEEIHSSKVDDIEFILRSGIENFNHIKRLYSDMLILEEFLNEK